MLDRRTLFKVVGSGLTLAMVPPSEIFAATQGKRYVMVFDVRRCTGCISCTVNCSLETTSPSDVSEPMLCKFRCKTQKVMFRRFRYLTSAISVTTRLVSRFAQLKLPTNAKKTASLLLTTTNVFTAKPA